MAITVRILAVSGIGFDITDRVEGLQWSNVNPGGDERCSFKLKGDWTAGFQEVKRGNIVRVEDGGACLFTGRIDDQDPAVDSDESVTVTAYGLGVRLKDNTMREVYVDADLSHWRPASVQRRTIAITFGFSIRDFTVAFDTTTGSPSLISDLHGPWGAAAVAMSDAWYDAIGIPIGSIFYAWNIPPTPGITGATDANWSWDVLLCTDDIITAADQTGDLEAAGPSTGTLTSTTSTRILVLVRQFYGSGLASTADNSDFGIRWSQLAVYGKHGLTKQGSESATTHKGFFASQLVSDIVGRVTGLLVRNAPTSTFVVPQAAYLDDTHHEDAIIDASKFDSVDWGVWGADDLFGTYSDPTFGYFDWTPKNTSIATWTAWRDECDSVGLHTEVGATYDQVAVKYTDVSGGAHRELRTTAAPALADASIAHRTATLDGGTLTQAGAQKLGDVFLALSAGAPVARGSAAIGQPIRHITRGFIAPWFMRADGSNLCIPDALPDSDAFALQTSADRRSVFPIKRVNVDCSGDKPIVTAEFDQTNDLFAILQARLQVNALTAIG